MMKNPDWEGGGKPPIRERVNPQEKIRKTKNFEKRFGESETVSLLHLNICLLNSVWHND